MARPKLKYPEILYCKFCGKSIPIKKHTAARWRLGQKDFYCNNICRASDRVGQKRPEVSARMMGNQYRLNQEPGNKKYKVNQEYFKDIDTEGKAYWLGYLLADGGITIGDCWRLNLISIDLELLTQFKHDVDSNHPILSYKNQLNSKEIYYISISDKIFVNYLVGHGVIPRKTNFVIFPDIDPKLLNHFIRGYWDGDGHISIDKNHRFQTGVVGTQFFVEELAKKLKVNCDLKSNTYYRHSGKTYCFKRSQNQALKICDYLYRDATRYLERKHNHYLQYMERYTHAV